MSIPPPKVIWLQLGALSSSIHAITLCVCVIVCVMPGPQAKGLQ